MLWSPFRTYVIRQHFVDLSKIQKRQLKNKLEQILSPKNSLLYSNSLLYIYNFWPLWCISNAHPQLFCLFWMETKIEFQHVTHLQTTFQWMADLSFCCNHIFCLNYLLLLATLEKTSTRLLAIAPRLIAITILAKKVIDNCNKQLV